MLAQATVYPQARPGCLCAVAGEPHLCATAVLCNRKQHGSILGGGGAGAGLGGSRRVWPLPGYGGHGHGGGRNGGGDGHAGPAWRGCRLGRPLPAAARICCTATHRAARDSGSFRLPRLAWGWRQGWLRNGALRTAWWRADGPNGPSRRSSPMWSTCRPGWRFAMLGWTRPRSTVLRQSTRT